jgi:hypothetical protein
VPLAEIDCAAVRLPQEIVEIDPCAPRLRQQSALRPWSSAQIGCDGRVSAGFGRGAR